jgi:hypothetical protein
VLSTQINYVTNAMAVVTVSGGFIATTTIRHPGSGYVTAPSVVLTGGGLTVNKNDDGTVGLTAINSIFSDAVNLANVGYTVPGVTTQTNIAPTDPNGAGGSGLLMGQYCNGARIPPEQCSSAQGANNPAACLGYFTPAGISENVGVPQVFRFANIAATATVDEGNNWINMTYGPLTLSLPSTTTPVETATTKSTPAEQIVTVAPVGSVAGAYSLPLGSGAINKGTNAGAPAFDFYGNPRALSATNPADIGAVEYPGQSVDMAITKTASSPTVSEGGVVTYTLTVSNGSTTGTFATAAAVVDTAPNGISFVTWTCTTTVAGDSCGAAAGTGSVNTTVSLAAGDSAVISISATAGTKLGSVTNTATVTAPTGVPDSNPANNTASVAVTVTRPTPMLATISITSVLTGASRNAPDVVPVTLTGANLTGVNQVSATGGVTCNTIVVAVGGTSMTTNCSIPSNATTGTQTLTVTSPVNGTSNGLTFVVSGRPTFTGAGAFGSHPLTSVTAGTFIYANPGPTPIVMPMAATTVTGSAFSLSADKCSGQPLAAAGTCVVIVDFTPTATGAAPAGTVSVAATGMPVLTVALTGSGVAQAISLGNGTLTFNSAATRNQLVTLTNNTAGVFTLSSATLTGTGGNGSFTVGANNCSAVASGSTCTISVTFTPQATGSTTTPRTLQASGSSGGLSFIATRALSGR